MNAFAISSSCDGNTWGAHFTPRCAKDVEENSDRESEEYFFILGLFDALMTLTSTCLRLGLITKTQSLTELTS